MYTYTLQGHVIVRNLFPSVFNQTCCYYDYYYYYHHHHLIISTCILILFIGRHTGVVDMTFVPELTHLNHTLSKVSKLVAFVFFLYRKKDTEKWKKIPSLKKGTGENVR